MSDGPKKKYSLTCVTCSHYKFISVCNLNICTHLKAIERCGYQLAYKVYGSEPAQWVEFVGCGQWNSGEEATPHEECPFLEGEK